MIFLVDMSYKGLLKWNFNSFLAFFHKNLMIDFLSVNISQRLRQTSSGSVNANDRYQPVFLNSVWIWLFRFDFFEQPLSKNCNIRRP